MSSLLKLRLVIWAFAPIIPPTKITIVTTVVIQLRKLCCLRVMFDFCFERLVTKREIKFGKMVRIGMVLKFCFNFF